MVERIKSRCQMVVSTLEDFKQNCYLLESSLAQDLMNPMTDLNNLKTWVALVAAGQGTEEHNKHFYSYSLPRIIHALLKRRLVSVVIYIYSI